jgi:cell wall-associated NlpC family hydrolase
MTRKKIKWSSIILITCVICISIIANPAAASSPDKDKGSLIKSFIGLPYAKPAASPESGFDSAGFLQYVYSSIGYSVPRTLQLQYTMNAPTIDRISELVIGDALYFSDGDRPQYAAIYIGNQQMVMSSLKEGEVMTRTLTGKYIDVFLGAKRIISERDIIKENLVISAQQYLGVPYKFGAKMGQTKTFDCSSFTKTIFEQNGIIIPRVSRQQAKEGVYVSKKDLQTGDLVFFTTRDSGEKIGHVGLYVGDDMMIHTYGDTGLVYASIEKNWWKTHYVTARRIF